MSAPLKIVCPHCDVVNKLPADKLGAGGQCGKCKKKLFAGKAATLTSANAQRHFEQSDIPVVVDCWASWCGPCKSFAPTFNQAAKKLEPAFRFAKLDTEKEQRLATRFRIQSIPTLLVFKKGKEVARQAGVMNLSQFEAWLKPYMP
ncbi:MAG TPA: thioredoxin TrxC [Cycloclasticus sp.]|jgi:thioredoxin 2|nr:thioredoxin TrxC [Cycloclasticus sp.]